MLQEHVAVPTADGESLPALLHLPPASPAACVVFLHCLPAEDGPALRNIAAACADRGWAVLQVDCGVIDRADDLIAAADWLRRRFPVPLLLLGHSLGGALALALADRIAVAGAIVTLNAPAGIGGYSSKAKAEAGVLQLGSRSVEVLPSVAEALDWNTLQPRIERLRRPLLVMHAPVDTCVELPNAAQLFTSAKHPKSFVAVDGGDHMLSRPAAAQYAADIIGAWARRYLQNGERDESGNGGIVVELGQEGRFRSRVRAGRHHLVADEPLSAGGADAGPAPYDLLLAALGACTVMTLRMYADAKQLPLTHVSVALRHEKIHAQDCAECETREGRIDRIERVIRLEGNLNETQRARLLEIANRCPVHRTLHSEVTVPTRLAD